MKNILPQRRSRALVWLTVLVASIMLATTGAAAAAITYDQRNRNVVLHGVTVGEVSIGGLTYTQAKQKLIRKFETPLDRSVIIQADGHLVHTTPRAL